MKTQSQKIRLAIVYDAIYPYIKGGAEKRNYELSKRLARHGFEVSLYGMKLWDGENVIKKDSVYLKGICKSVPLYTKDGRRSISQAVYFGIHCLKLIKEDFDVIDVDHMPFFSIFAIKIVCILKRKKMYATWNEVWGKSYWNTYLGRLGTIAYGIEWLSSKLPNEIIAVSEHTKRKLVQELKVRQKIHVIPNGIDYDEIQKVNPSKEKSDLIFAGRLLSHKNVDILIQVSNILKKSYPNLKTIIIGSGPEKLKYQKLIQTLHLENNIKLVNFFRSPTQLYAVLKSSKVFVFPSVREGFGMVALEANACGIPFVTTNYKDNATKDLITADTNGKAVKLTVERFAQAIKSQLESQKSSNMCKKVSKQYDWDTITSKLVRVYQ